MQKRIDLVFSLTLLLVVVGAIWMARDWRFATRLFPLVVAVPLAVGLALRVLYQARAIILGDPIDSSAPSPPDTALGEARPSDGVIGEQRLSSGDDPSDRIRHRQVEIVAWIGVFLLGMLLLGFKVGATFMTLVFLRLAARESWRVAVSFALGTYLFFVILDAAIGVPVPAGYGAELFGLSSLDPMAWVAYFMNF